MPVIAEVEQVRMIDVIAVDLQRYPDWSQWTSVPGNVPGTWTGEQVQDVLELVAALPEAEQMRCFVPASPSACVAEQSFWPRSPSVSAATTR